MRAWFLLGSCVCPREKNWIECCGLVMAEKRVSTYSSTKQSKKTASQSKILQIMGNHRVEVAALDGPGPFLEGIGLHVWASMIHGRPEDPQQE